MGRVRDLVFDEGGETVVGEREMMSRPSAKGTLNFAEPAVENQFWLFNLQTLPVSDLNVMVLLGITYVLATVARDASEDDRGAAYRIASPTISFLQMFLTICHAFLHVAHRCGRVETETAISVSHGLLGFCIVMSTGFSLLNIYAREWANSCNVAAWVDDPRGVYQFRNCNHFLQGWVAVLLTLGVLLRLSLRAMIAVGGASVAIACVMSAGYGTTVSISHIQPPYVAFMAAFSIFMRYRREYEEREDFVAYLALEKEIAHLQLRRQDLDSLCRSVIPPLVLDRAELAAPAPDFADEAAVICVSAFDFATFCGQHLPLVIAKSVEVVRVRLWRQAAMHGLQGVIAFQDQFTAVGNLLSTMHTSEAVRRCVQLALEVASGEIGRVADAPLPEMRAAVHVGRVCGGFIGKRWVRYDVLGEGVDQCRWALGAAVGKTALITRDALQQCREDVAVRELGAIGDATADQPHVGTPELSTTLFVIDSIAAEDPEHKICGLVEQKTTSSAVLAPQSANSSGNTADLGEWMTTVAKALDLTKKNAMEIDEEYNMSKQWCFFDKFVSGETEKEFLESRAKRMSPESSLTWLAFAVVVLLLLMVLVADFEGPRAPAAAVALIFACLLSILAALYPSLIGDDNFLRFHVLWSAGAILIPLGVVLACAAARPSLIGNDMKTVLVIGTYLRSTCFTDTKYQLLVKPLMLILAHLHVLLPGARIRTVTVVAYTLVLWTVAIDRDVDRSQRNRFVIDARLQQVMVSLREERRVRHGLLRSTMPPIIFDHILRTGLQTIDAACVTVSNTAVMLISMRHEAGEANPIIFASHQLKRLESQLVAFPRLTLAAVFGDAAVVVSPIRVPISKQRSPAPEAVTVEEAVLAAKSLVSGDPRSVLLEFDETVQVTRIRGVPSFNIFGPGMTRMLAVSQALGSSLRGVVVTSRVIQMLDSIGHDADRASLGPMKIRGVGVIRLTRID